MHRLEHGGSTRLRKRKETRFIDVKSPLHVVLRASRARAEWSMLKPKNRHHIDALTRRLSAKYKIKIYRFANVGNHLHLLVKTPEKTAFKNFLRELAGQIAILVTGACKGNPVGRFWDLLAYSRVVSWIRDFKTVERYIIKNLFEAEGAYTKSMKKARVRMMTLTRTGPPEFN